MLDDSYLPKSLFVSKYDKTWYQDFSERRPEEVISFFSMLN